MAHLSDSILRRLYDEPLSVTEKDRAHLGSCPRCQSRFEPVAALARESMAALAVPGATVDAQAALDRLRPRLGPPVTRIPWRPRLLGTSRRSWVPRLAAIGLAAALSVALVGAGVAQDALKIFEPQSIQVVPIATGDVAGLPDLSRFGEMTVQSKPELKEASSALDAATTSGLPLLPSGGLPASIDLKHVSYGTIPVSRGSFTFSARKAEAYAASTGRSIPTLRSGLDGSTLTVSGGPAEFEVFGELGRSGAQPATGAAQPGTGGISQLPALAIGAMRAPVVTSSGVTVKQLEDYLKALDPKLAPAIDAIGDKGSVLPIPVPVDRAQQTAVTIHGVPGVALGDNTGLGSAVIWERDGIIWAVAGTISQSQAIAIANSIP